MKKLSAILMAFALAFSSVGTVMLVDDVQTVEAKSYKSGKKATIIILVQRIISKIIIQGQTLL